MKIDVQKLLWAILGLTALAAALSEGQRWYWASIGVFCAVFLLNLAVAVFKSTGGDDNDTRHS